MTVGRVLSWPIIIRIAGGNRDVVCLVLRKLGVIHIDCFWCSDIMVGFDDVLSAAEA